MLSVRLPAALEQQLGAHCRNEGISKTRFVERAIQRELAQGAMANSFELLQKHLKGAKGEAHDASADASRKVKAKLRRNYDRAQRSG